MQWLFWSAELVTMVFQRGTHGGDSSFIKSVSLQTKILTCFDQFIFRPLYASVNGLFQKMNEWNMNEWINECTNELMNKRMHVSSQLASERKIARKRNNKLSD